MKTICILAALLATVAFAAPLNDLRAFGYNPVANPKAVIQAGNNARFTVLTDAVIRMEYSHTGTFEDRATVMAVNRALPVPTFTQKTSNGFLTIQTSKVTLKYQIGQQFASYTLSATTAGGASWKWGDVDSGNLLGTIRSLDELCTISLNCTVNANTQIHGEGLHCAWGVISRNGWTVVDDSNSYIMSSKEGEWFSSSLKNSNDNDAYFFGHGNDYRQALTDFTRISGSAPMQGKNMLGSWYTRWYDWDNNDLQQLISDYETNGLPLDTLILDMNWHTKNDWTGFSWDKQLFPYPNDTVSFVHYKGLKMGCNLHDADGVGWWEDKYPEMCKANGVDPTSKARVAFQPLSETYMHSLDDIVLTYTGFDLWWIDWQQGGKQGGLPGGALNPTLITNHVRGTDHLRRNENKRDEILARFSGIGGQRYPVGFSGDVQQLTWECMAYQPYFSATAANVGFMWSHDLVGPANDHELHVRWMQFGAYSSVMRIHDRGMSAGSCWPNCAVVNMWLLPWKYFDAIRTAMNERVALVPYMYTSQRAAFDTGVQMVHPVYFDWPTEQDAYIMGPDGRHAQYMFGDDILVAPICTAGDSNGLVSKSIWLPPVLWYDNVFGYLIKGGSLVTRSYYLDEIPTFIRAGSIIPRLPNPSKIGVTASAFDAVDVYIYPGADTNSYALYEDDGESMDYLKGASGFQNISYIRDSNTSITILVSPSTGTYNNKVAQRQVRFMLEGSMPAASVTVNGQPIGYTRYDTVNSFGYDGKTGTARIDVGIQSTSAPLRVDVTLATDQNDASIAFTKGYSMRARKAKHMMDNTRETPYSTSVGPGMLKQAGARAVELSYLAHNNINSFKTNIGAQYKTLIEEALKEIGGNPQPPPPSPADTGLIQMWSATRHDMLLCGSKQCMEVNSDYQVMWTEGYQPVQGASGAVSLNDWYNNQLEDNWADVKTSAPESGYSAAVFSNGYVQQNNDAGTECLEIWFNPSSKDHMTLSSPGKPWALKNGYIKVNPCIAYVYIKAPSQESPEERMRRELRDAAKSGAQELLQTVLFTA